MEQTIKHGLIHCHTENSLKDSTLTPARLVARAKEMGAPAVTLTDHGTLTGIFEFIKAAKEVNEDAKAPYFGVYDIKAIPGVEAYVQEDADRKRMHLLLLAKNYTGYQAIYRAVTKSNTRIKEECPCFNMEIIQEYFATGSAGHGNVIATSACVGGVLSQILLRNSALQQEVDKLARKASKYSSPNDPVYLENLRLESEYHASVERLIARRNELKKIAEMKFTKWERTVSKMTGEDKKAAEAELLEKKQRTLEAAQELDSVKSELAKTKRRETAARQACNEAKKDHEKWNFYQKEIERVKSGFASEDDLYAEAKAQAETYAKIFGAGNFYIELQYHGIPDEAYVMPKLVQIAKELNLPLVACNDVHFANDDPADVRARSLVGALRFNKWLPEREDSSEYYIKDDATLKKWLLDILDEPTVDSAFQGISNIVNACDVKFPHETHYPKFTGGIAGETAEGRLRRLTEEGIAKRYPGQKFAYRDRVEYELEIINKMQYTDYLCIVQDYLEYGRQLGKDCPEGVGYSIGPGRGSAAGSLVCYLIGITSVDPMPLGLLFERFLNPDRVSSPDIDADLSMEVRGKVLEYVKAKYGDEAVCCIMTKGTLAAKAAIKAVARVRGSEKCDDIKTFYELGNAIAKIIPNEPGVKLADYESDMRAAFPDDNDAQEIISDAMLIEGTAVNYGMHAAGVIIADNGDVGEYIPLMWNEDNSQWCSQCDMTAAEAQGGLLKFDFLGLRNLDIISMALRLIKRNTGLSIDIEKIPQEAQIYHEIFARGRTNFVFQFESDGMKNLLRKFKPENLEHLILLNALFRPGPLQYADAICEVKFGKKKPSYICEQAKDVLAVTYGYPVYQEQIMQVCNKIAGFSLGEADLVRRYMSKKKAKELAKFKPKFILGLTNSGVNETSAEEFWDQLMDFAKYAFNKSHAAVYATIAYYTAWLKFHYPTEYMTAVLNYTPVEKLPKMIQECKSLGVKVMAPDINHSAVGFTGKNSEILFGLGNIKNVGNGTASLLQERNMNGPFRSYKDLLTRVKPSQKVCEALINAGAMDRWCSNRAALKAVLGNLLSDIKKIVEKENLIGDIREALANESLTEEERTDLQKKMDRAIIKRNEYKERFDYTVLPVSMPENKSAKLANENELLGMYISCHPLEEYPDAKKLRTSLIDEAAENAFVSFCGVVTKLAIKKRKKDGKPMAFFTLEDESGVVECCCFSKAYDKIGSVLHENIVVVLDGKFAIEEDAVTEEIVKKLYVEDAKVLQPKPKKLLVTVYGLHQWAEVVYPQLLPYVDQNGSEVVVYDSALGEFRKTTMRITRDILQADIDKAEIIEADI